MFKGNLVLEEKIKMSDKIKPQPKFEIPGLKKETLEAINKRLNFQEKVMWYVVFVIGLGFISMILATFNIFIQYKNFTSEKYSEFNAALEESKRMIIEEKDRNTQEILSNITSEIERLSNIKK